MRLGSRIKWRAGLTIAAIAATTGTLSLPAAGTASPAALVGEERIADTAIALRAALGAGDAGSYVDSRGHLIVNVTDSAAAATVRRSGAIPRLVAHSGPQLTAAIAELDRSARVPGTAWAVDPVTNQIVVRVDDSVRGTSLAQVTAVVAGLGGLARVERQPGRFATRAIAGGRIYYGAGDWMVCSVGFNVKSGTRRFFLTAGHCADLDIHNRLYPNKTSSAFIGDTVASSFPGNDYAVVTQSGAYSHPGGVMMYDGLGTIRDITNAATPYVGQRLARSGAVTHLRRGHVTALNATVNYPEGTVTGLIQTDMCVASGDSGGPLFSGTVGYGITSGGTACPTTGVSYYQPLVEALYAYGVSLY